MSERLSDHHLKAQRVEDIFLQPQPALERENRDQLCELTKVLGGGCEKELIAGTGWPSQLKTIELEDSF